MKNLETLGRGSPNTISRHRQSLMAERIRDSGEIPAGTTEADVHGIVIELLDRVWGEAGEAADAIVQQKTKESERAVNQARALKGDALEKVIALEAALQVMTDGDAGLRCLQLAVLPKAKHILDWFHLTRHLTIIKRVIHGEEAIDQIPSHLHEPLHKALTSLKWRLWHGQFHRAISRLRKMLFTLKLTTISRK